MDGGGGGNPIRIKEIVVAIFWDLSGWARLTQRFIYYFIVTIIGRNKMPKYTTQQLEQRAMRNVFARSPAVDESRYGEPETLETSAGRKIAVKYRSDSVSYLVPSDAAWTAGVGAIQIDKAYRILDESEGKASVREVKDSSELESVASGYMLEIMKVLKKK